MQTEETQDIVKYQWKKGEKFGEIVTLKSSDSDFLYFENGSKIFKNVAPEFLEEIKDDVIPFPGAKAIEITKPVPEKKSNIETTAKEEIAISKKEQDSPLTQLIKNLSSKNVESFNMDIGINLPKKEIFNMLVENSEQDKNEIINEISVVASSQIEINNLQEFLKEEIQKFVNNYYKL